MKLKSTSIFISLFYLAACAQVNPTPQTQPIHLANPLAGRETLQISYNTQSSSGSLKTYIAETDEEKTQGLMFVKELPKDYGMIFIYDFMAQPIFWMKNMEISLDFLWLDDQGKVVDITENAPPCRKENDSDCERYHPQVPAQYVLEVPEGWVEEVRMQVGDRFELEVLK